MTPVAFALALLGACRHPMHDGAANRVVTAAPSFTEIAFALGRGARVVGVSDYCDYPPAAASLPRVGGLVDLNVERTLSLRPDLVVLLQDFPEADGPIRDAGVRTLLLESESFADVDRVVGALGRELDAVPEARALVRRLHAGLAAIRARVRDLPHPRVLWVLEHRPGTIQDVIAAGGGSFLSEVIEAAGGTNAMAGVRQGALPLSTEALIASRPDVILDSTADPAGAAPWRTLASLPAVAANRIVPVRDPMFTRPGPRIVRASDAIARILHPTAFGAP